MTRTVFGRSVAAAVILLGLAYSVAIGQAQAPTPAAGRAVPFAEDVFKNVPVLRGVPVDEFMDTMGMFSAALNLNCTDCHTAASAANWAAFAEETPLKQTARRMVLMVNTINKNFGGQRRVTCYTCHQGSQRPKAAPDLAVQYGPPTEDPNDMEIFTPAATDFPTAAQVLDRYIAAIGGAQQVARLTSYVAKGTYEGFDTDHVPVPVELFAKTPDQRTTVIRAPFGEKVSTYDGRAAWMSSADRPLPLLQLTGGNLDSARVEALTAFPAQIRNAFSEWRIGATTLQDRDVYIVQGRRSGQLPVNFYFDQESSLLIRMVRWNDTVVGLVPTQVEYDDYREVAGTRMPFRWVTTWTNGQATIALNSVEANVAIDAARFARPAPATSR